MSEPTPKEIADLALQSAGQNAHILVPQLVGLQHVLLNPQEEEAAARREGRASRVAHKADQLSLLGYALEGAFYWAKDVVERISNLANLEAEAREFHRLRDEQSKRGVDEEPDYWYYGVPYSVLRPIQFAVDAYLDSARRAQNALTHYLRRWLVVRGSRARGFTKSMEDLAEQLQRQAPPAAELPTSVKDEILAYWYRRTGRQVRRYRNLVQHYGIAPSGMMLWWTAQEYTSVYFCLPDDPSADPPSARSYARGDVRVAEFVIRSLLELYQMLFRVTADLYAPLHGSATHQRVMALDLPVGKGGLTGHQLDLMPVLKINLEETVAGLFGEKGYLRTVEQVSGIHFRTQSE